MKRASWKVPPATDLWRCVELVTFRHAWLSPQAARAFVFATASLALLIALACGSSPRDVVFTSDRDGNLEIYAGLPNVESPQNLTNSLEDEHSPRVSPDGRLVAFLSGTGEVVAIEVMRVDGTERQRLTPGSATRRSHRWSPDSSRIAYVEGVDAESRIFVVNADGSEPAQVTSIPGDAVGGWSRDGVSVIFSVSQGPKLGIYTRNPDGVNEIRLTDTPDISAVWSPKSDRIAFLSERDDNLEMYVMKAAGSEQKRVTESDAPEHSLSWSPDGKRLLFVSERDGNPEVYVADADGSDQKRLTHNDVRDEQPAWSPDGGRIAFVSYVDGDAEIIVMDLDGGNQKRVTNNSSEDTEPSW